VLFAAMVLIFDFSNAWPKLTSIGSIFATFYGIRSMIAWSRIGKAAEHATDAPALPQININIDYLSPDEIRKITNVQRRPDGTR
jgi:hypothetical protein